MFDYARLEDGKIVERIQQSDTLSQLTQMHAGAAKKGAVAATLLELSPSSSSGPEGAVFVDLDGNELCL